MKARKQKTNPYRVQLCGVEKLEYSLPEFIPPTRQNRSSPADIYTN